MTLTQRKTRSLRLLIIYMISTLLFLTSTELHIHTEDAAHSASHGHAVSISSFFSSLDPDSSVDEISVNPDGLLKIESSVPAIIALFILLALVVNSCCTRYCRFLRECFKRIELPFYGTPTLRAPPR